MIQILNKFESYPWEQSNGISFRGYFIIDGILYKKNDAILYIADELNDGKKFEDILIKLNGVFSVIVLKENFIYFATDRIRSLPLFYSILENQLIISDSANSVYEELPQISIDPISYEDFQKNGLYVTGQYTLFNEIKQVQAGEWVKFNCNDIILQSDFYFIHAEGNIKNSSQEELTYEFRKLFKKASLNLELALDNRTALVSLSGGTDSRELLLMLKIVGYKKVICFSYGRKGSKDCVYAKELADYFGYPWIEITYTRHILKNAGINPSFNDYFNRAGNFSSLPHIQDFTAINILKSGNLIPNDSVFMPGHTGAIIGGVLYEEFLEEKNYTHDNITAIVKRHVYSKTNSKTFSNGLLKRIDRYFDVNKCSSNTMSEAQCHCFSMKEKQAKFIVNSIRCYEHFNYEWLLPLCDLEFLNFMKTLPLELKHGKRFIRDFIGLKSIRSTSDSSLYKKISSIIRSIPLLRKTIRKLSKFTKYFTSSNQLEGLYGFANYIKGCFLENEHFSINTLVKQRYLNMVKHKEKFK